MVTRKPVPNNASPDSTVTDRPGPQQEGGHMWPGTDGEASSETIWASEQPQHQRTPSPGHGYAGGSTSTGIPDVPDSLRPGATPPGPPPASQYSAFDAPPDENVWSDRAASPLTADRTGVSVSSNNVPDALRPGPPRTETNPFKRKPTPNSVAQNGGQPAPPPLILTEPPTPPTAPFSQLNISADASRNPWQPALNERTQQPPQPQPLATHADEQDELGNDVWTSANVSTNASRRPSASNLTGSPSLISFPTEEDGSAAWDEVAAPPKPRAPVGTTEVEEYEDRHAWDDVGGENGKGKAPERPPHPSAQSLASSNGRGSEWNFVDNDPQPGQLSRRSTWEDFDDPPDQPHAGTTAEQTAEEPMDMSLKVPVESLIDVSEGSQSEPQGQPSPPPPPRTSSAAAPLQPPRTVDGKSETYQIKNINWYDASATSNPRTSPILVQNENGPCPLVALVNALTLTTPAGVETALVETLRSREQISLSFLLDAVFDELMSHRRLAEDTQLPDITELYAFLKGLHTGMNVNPRFVPTAEVIKAFKRTSLTHIHPTERSDNMIPGTFEDTMEMRLYSIFSVPLIHGWLPPQGDMAYDAFARRAESYEDAQNLLFREEELEDRLMGAGSHGQEAQGLTEDEQAIYQDILTIKSFLADSGTQLTRHGLGVITAAMKPGSVAILFRNDHFSTLYRHPDTLNLMTLVTDAGYASHAEVVWESLVDTTGESAEFFSGDFRVVGGASLRQQETMDRPQQQHQRSVSEGGGTWTTGAGRGDRGNGGGGSSVRRATMSTNDGPPLSPSSEQEDRDLALAMQLQEEEDQRHREEQARRQRERLLSEQFIEQQARGNSAGGAGAAGNNEAFTGGGLVSQIPNARRSSAAASQASTTSVNAQGRRVNSVSGASVGGNTRGSTGPARTQVVRPLITPVVATQRAADAGDDAPPPSYEQASKQQAYIPPEGHPSHPASSPRASTASASASAAANSPRASNTGMRQRGAAPGSSAHPGLPPGGRPMRQGVPPSSGSVGRDRDCVVM